MKLFDTHDLVESNQGLQMLVDLNDFHLYMLNMVCAKNCNLKTD